MSTRVCLVVLGKIALKDVENFILAGVEARFPTKGSVPESVVYGYIL